MMVNDWIDVEVKRVHSWRLRRDCLPYPSLLSAPVTLTLTLSRQAGEGNLPLTTTRLAES